MAALDDLVSQVSDTALREALVDAIARVKQQQRFGLVFEQHIPEVTPLKGFPIAAGASVQRRDDLQSGITYQVLKLLSRKRALLDRGDGSATCTVPIADLVPVKRFGEPIYSTLTPLGEVDRTARTKPAHAVVCGENLHALQLLAYLYAGRVDCIYLDPPYNSGARDWKYNNRYVDDSDIWRHSKWLSFIDRRLRLAKRLLAPDGVLIVTIDENEVHHLGLLLESIFPEYSRPMVTIIISAQGNAKDNFSRVEEYAFFCCPNVGREVITGSRNDYLPSEAQIDFDPEDQEDDDETADEDGDQHTPEPVILRENARRRGKDSLRRDRSTMFYPIFIDEDRRIVVRAGYPIPLDEDPDFAYVDGLRPIWPIDSHDHHRRWRWGHETMQQAIEAGEISLGKHNKKRDTWTINRTQTKTPEHRKLKTVWRLSSHAAGTHGSGLLERFLGKGQAFPFPKSVYAVRDCLAAVVRNKPNAIILDCFAGSGTTFHATCLLNTDGGSRTSILVTNNEVEEQTALSLNRAGYFPGDDQFENHGIFREVTRPRCEAAVTGVRPDGQPVPGRYLDRRPHKAGFEERVEFFQLDYLDPDDVDLGNRFEAIHPLLWLGAGGIGTRQPLRGDPDFLIAEESTYAVLFREACFRQFHKALLQRRDITHVWLVTDSEEAYAEMRAVLQSHVPNISMLYKEYLRNFRINTGHSK